MIRVKLALAAVAVLTFAASDGVGAQESVASRIRVGGGIAVPVGDFGSYTGVGIGLGATYETAFRNHPLRLDAEFVRHGISTADGSVRQFGATVNGLFPWRDGVYGLAGAGLFGQVLSVDGFGSETELAPALNAGVGFARGRWSIEAGYRAILSADPAHALPITFRWQL